MTGRERVLCAINHEEPDRVPRFDSFWEETQEAYGRTADQLAEEFQFDMLNLALDNSMRFPVSRRDEGEWEVVCDRCGYTARRHKGKATLEFIKHENGGPEDWGRLKERFTLEKDGESRVDTRAYFLRTDPAPSWPEAVRRMNESGGGKFRMINFYGPLEGTWRHHGYAETMMDLLAEPEYSSEMFEAITNLTIETLEYALSLGLRLDGAWMVEDMGSTRAPLIGPQTYRELLLPWHKKLGDYLRSRNLKFLVHSCGDIHTLLPGLIEAGVEVIQPLQANTTLHVAKLKEELGDKLCFWGNISVQALAGTREEIRREVLSKVVPAMKGGGYIYHSDHSVPPEVPYENYRYLMELLGEYGVY